ncbi:MAG TPA: PIN domain-containing protein [Vicinamibacteria bacterium]|nr:PIN domain-containing protein [Vicinamibacteria bacterium]
MLNLDTHVLIHALAGDLEEKERKLLSQNTWSISAIVLWELSKLAQLGRIELDLEAPKVERALRRIHTWPLTLEICRQSCRLDIKSDPADELIAATSVIENIPLVTQDRVLLGSEMIPFPDRLL